MSNRGIREIYKDYRYNEREMREVLILQVLFDDHGVVLTDGKNTIHLNIGKEEQTKKNMVGMLEDGGLGEENLNQSHFSFTNITFLPHWDSSKKELKVSLESDLYRLVSPGPDKPPSRRLFYITSELSKRREEILKRRSLASKAKLHEEIDMLDLLNPISKGKVDESTIREDIAGEEEEEEDYMSSDNITFKADNMVDTRPDETEESRGVTPNKVDENQYDHQYAKLFVTDAFVDQSKENMFKQVESSLKDLQNVMSDVSNLMHKEKAKKPALKSKKGKSKPVEKVKEKIEDFNLEDIENELDDLQEDLEKKMVKLKTNSEPIMRGGNITRTLEEDEDILKPQVLGFSFSALTTDN